MEQKLPVSPPYSETTSKIKKKPRKNLTPTQKLYIVILYHSQCANSPGSGVVDRICDVWKCNKGFVSIKGYDFDHIVERSKTYDDRLENYQLLCTQCHAYKTRTQVERMKKAKQQLLEYKGKDEIMKAFEYLLILAQQNLLKRLMTDHFRSGRSMDVLLKSCFHPELLSKETVTILPDNFEHRTRYDACLGIIMTVFKQGNELLKLIIDSGEGETKTLEKQKQCLMAMEYCKTMELPK